MNVLGNAHAPKDHGAACPAEDPRYFADGACVDATDRADLLGREILHVVFDDLEVFGVGLHILLVIELFRHDDVHHSIEQRHVAARTELQHVLGIALQYLPARVHNNELRAILGSLLEIGSGDWMVLSRVDR